MKLRFQQSFIMFVLALIITIPVLNSSFSQEENTEIKQQQKVNKSSHS
ncbi:MAG TPA: hypothetical protein VFM28_03950 [Nitrososphaeraceae archaeon]|jgi:hypothetical protein|nr:hypothetical protein [Nitrososphaeraceae archaeon]